jgi:hypothetical protein
MTYNVLRKQYLTKSYQKKQIERYFGDRFVCFLNDKDKKYISFIVKDRIKITEIPFLVHILPFKAI